MANLKDVIYLSAEDYNTLYTNGTITINGVTLTYDANNVYIVPDNTQQQIDDILAKIPSNASSSNKMLTADDISAWAKASTKPSYNYSEIGNTPTLATVATSGDYDDLDNKPSLGTDAYKSNIFSTGTTTGFTSRFDGEHTYLIISTKNGNTFISILITSGSMSSATMSFAWTVLRNDNSKFSYENNIYGTISIKYESGYGTWPTLIIKIA